MLSTLIGSEQTAAFVDSYWMRRPYNDHRALSDLPAWLLHFAESGLPDLVALPNTRSVAMYRDASGTLQSLPAAGRHALKMYRDHGCTICLSDVELPGNDKPREDLRALAHSLGMPGDAVQVNLYVSPAGAGLAPHWDHTDALIVQLQGSKTWTLAANGHVPNPRHNHVPGAFATGEVRCLPGSAARMPREVESVSLEPGSVLYVPRGFWHATRAERPSVSVAIKVRPTSWGDLLVRHLEAELNASADWRELASGVWGENVLRERALRRLDGLLRDFSERLRRRPLTALDLVRAANPENRLASRVQRDSLLARNPAVRVSAEERAGDRARIRLGVPGATETLLDVAEDLLAVCAALGDMPPDPSARVRAADLIGTVDEAAACELLALFVEAGALSVVE